ncbi:MAG TPA: SPOR domain-containing protein, partial [Gemmatimonadaceae bacterium]|nr:SPOR domain-containing protein [Gemmatimonadaceae bacterium]
VVEKTIATTKSEYSVQVAAYKTRADADKLTESLKRRGYEARVDVSPDWFRVRVGRYASERAAESKLREMKTKQISGFVVRAPDR